MALWHAEVIVFFPRLETQMYRIGTYRILRQKGAQKQLGQSVKVISVQEVWAALILPFQEPWNGESGRKRL